MTRDELVEAIAKALWDYGERGAHRHDVCSWDEAPKIYRYARKEAAEVALKAIEDAGFTVCRTEAFDGVTLSGDPSGLIYRGMIEAGRIK